MRDGWKYVIITILLVVITSGCATRAPLGQHEKEGMLGGALLGGLLGGIIGNNIGDNNNEAIGAAIGAAIGGTTAGNYGRSQDQINTRLSTMETRIDTESVSINNDNGSISRVTLRVLPDGHYIGPRGEEYPSKPTEAQLKPVYGLKY